MISSSFTPWIQSLEFPDLRQPWLETKSEAVQCLLFKQVNESVSKKATTKERRPLDEKNARTSRFFKDRLGKADKEKAK